MIGQLNTAPSGGLGPQSANANAEARVLQGRFEAPSVRAETVAAVDPPQKGAETSALAKELRRNLIPPDPNAPAGPRPSFEATILDRKMEELMAPPDLTETVQEGLPDPYAVPPSAEVRAERDLTEIRRLDTSGQRPSVDVEL